MPRTARSRTASKKTTTRARTRKTATASRRTTTSKRTTARRSAGRSGGTTATRRRTATSTRRPASSSQLAHRTVEQVMSTDPLTMVSTETVAAAARTMRNNDIGDVIVLDETDGRVCGIVTDRDMVVRVMAEERDPEQTTLGAVCSRELVSIGPGDSVNDAVSLMRERAVRRLPVCEAGKAVGIVSIGDLAERFDERSALADISAAPPNN